MEESEIREICKEVDPFIADILVESIIEGTSYDILEAHYGVLPIGRMTFYRRKKDVQMLMEKRKNR